MNSLNQKLADIGKIAIQAIIFISITVVISSIEFNIVDSMDYDWKITSERYLLLSIIPLMIIVAGVSIWSNNPSTDPYWSYVRTFILTIPLLFIFIIEQFIVFHYIMDISENKAIELLLAFIFVLMFMLAICAFIIGVVLIMFVCDNFSKYMYSFIRFVFSKVRN